MVRSVERRVFLWCLIVFAAGRARRVTVCPGTRLSIQDLAEYSRKNCTVIEGRLLLVSTSSSNSGAKNSEITPLSSVVEITGTLEVVWLDNSVDNLSQILPNLAVVRGSPHHRYPEVNASVVIAYNEYLKSISLTRLTHILGDDTTLVVLWFNRDLQYIHRVKWKWISSSGKDAYFLGNPAQETSCSPDCNGSCWNRDSCQISFPDNCSAVDTDGNCSCHEECLSLCNGTTDADCLSCKHFYHQGQCVPSCPNGTVMTAGWRCVDQCPYVESGINQSGKRRPRPMFAFNNKCVLDCPRNYTKDNHTKTCVPCSNTSSCEKRCPGGSIGSLYDAERFQGCVHVEGNLIINILTDSNENGELSRYLGSVKHVDGYVVVEHSPRLKTLEFLDNLTSISANQLMPIKKFITSYGLVIRNNRNLLSVQWKEQPNLWLGGRMDVGVLIASNYLVCQDSVIKLRSQFPGIPFEEHHNGYLAVCTVGHLNVSTQENSSDTVYLQWDPVPHENQDSLIGYQILWQVVGVIRSVPHLLAKEYDENNPESCENTWWRSVSVYNVTSYKLDRKMLQPWNTTVFQVRAEFTEWGIAFKSGLLHVNGPLAVPSCPIIEAVDCTSFSGTIIWWPPKHYSQNVTHYRIAVTLIDKPKSMENMLSPLGNITSYSKSCSMDTAIGQSHPSCIEDALDVNDSCKGGWCNTTITGLSNYFEYQVEIQATNPAGCGLISQVTFFTKPDYLLDKVSDLDVTTFPGRSPSSEKVQVSWKRPQYPNGGYVQYYEVSIKFQMSQKEESNFQSSHNQWALPHMKELGCSYSSGSQQSWYSCQIRSNKTWVSLNLTLMRIPGRQLSYNVTVRVASALGKPTTEVPHTQTQFTVSAAPFTASPNPQRSVSEPVASSVIGPVVVVSLLLSITVLLYYVWRQKRKQKHQLRGQMGAISHLYVSLNGEVLTSGEYLPDEWEINRDEVVLGKELGHGAFGLVYQGTWQNPDGQPLEVAVKTLNREACREDRLSFLYEASVMKHFSTDHIVRLLGIVSQGTPVMVVMELTGNGDLKGYLRSLRPEDEKAINFEKFPISEEELLQIAVQIASGMVYLTDKKFVHCDLAARNCMVTGDLRIKIGDFGLTRDVYQSDYYRKKGQGALPVRWMPPESLRDGVFSHSSDMWSFGIVLWEVATLAMQPYPGMSNSDVFEYVVGGGVMDIDEMKHVPSTLLMIMERCWLYKPSDRPTFETILACLPPLDGIEIEI